MRPSSSSPPRETGAAAIEFALVAIAFFTLLLGIMEVGRLFYVNNTVQEVTRSAARLQTVKWVSAVSDVQKTAVFCAPADAGCSGTTVTLPAGAEVTNATVTIGFYNTYDDALTGSHAISPGSGKTAQDNLSNCLEVGNTDCIRYVRVSLQGPKNSPVEYVPMISLFSFFNVPLPGATVVMPAEALGLL